MPDYEITSPDGRRFVVTAPEGATQDQVLAYAQQNMPATQAPPASRGLGLGVRDVMQGLAAAPGMLYDAAAAPVNLAARGINALTGANIPYARSATENVDLMADAAGLPRPANPTERMLSTVNRSVGSILPTLGAGAALQAAGQAPELATMLAGNPVTQMVAAATGGAAQGAAAEAGAGGVGQALANAAGGIAGMGLAQGLAGAARGGAAMVQPFSQSGREAIAADALLRSSSDPRNLLARVREGLAATDQRLPGAVPSTGTAARDPGLLRVENSVASGAIGPAAQNTLRDATFARDALRHQAIRDLQDASTPGQRGEAIRRILADRDSEVSELVRRAYASVDPEGAARFPTEGIRSTVDDVIARYFGPGSGGPPAELSAIRNELPVAQTMRREVSDPLSVRPRMETVTTPSEVDWRYLQNLRSRLGEVAGRASAAGENRLAAAAGQTWDEVERAAQSVPGAEGLAQRWQDAAAMRRDQGRLFGRNDEGASVVGQILRNDRFGAPQMPIDAVPGAALGSPAQLRQTLEAAGEQAPIIREQLRGQLAEQLASRATGNAAVANSVGATQNTVSLGRVQDFLRSNREIIDTLYTGPERDRLNRLVADLTEGSMQANTGATRGSQTVQNLTVGNMLNRATSGLVGGESLFSSWTNKALRLVYALPEDWTRELIGRALVEPRFAQMLLERASPEAVRRAAGYLENTLQQRLTDAMERLTAQENLRLTIAPGPPQQQPGPGR
ncbi:hypothetical protein EOD42_23215 [Rhodovarius crocodyli]|uniref:Uncharacterized protein n=1 Tax=Rhodovarius crocodyli TaxID=1979269 RepID=A0A437LZM5_9PROT|nr:hypothetical protein [Rhodovarius crocodyli]RVT90714.1 hypothetical protein EOD42_23215 [Rhodovarius crocodyli]